MVTLCMLYTYTWGDSSNFIIKVSFPLFLFIYLFLEAEFQVAQAGFQLTT